MDKRIGAQLYTLRDFTKTKEDFDSSMKKLHDIGYKAVQISAVGPIAPEVLKEICDNYGMVIACTHKGFDEYVNKTDEMIEFHKRLGCDIAGLGSMPEEYRNIEKIAEFVEKMNVVAEKMSQNGITFAYHNHQFEFEKMQDGKFMMDYMIEHGNFDFIVDVYWLAVAGLNPAKYIRKMGKKAVVIHYKDLAVINHDVVMAEVMEGNLEWDEIIASSEEAGSRWAMVEQDVCRRDPFESMKISYNNLVTKGFC